MPTSYFFGIRWTLKRYTPVTGAVKIPSLTLKCPPPPGVMVRLSVKVMYLDVMCNVIRKRMSQSLNFT